MRLIYAITKIFLSINKKLELHVLSSKWLAKNITEYLAEQ